MSQGFKGSGTGRNSDMIAVFQPILLGRLIEIKSKLRRKENHRTNQGSSFFDYHEFK